MGSRPPGTLTGGPELMSDKLDSRKSSCMQCRNELMGCRERNLILINDLRKVSNSTAHVRNACYWARFSLEKITETIQLTSKMSAQGMVSGTDQPATFTDIEMYSKGLLHALSDHGPFPEPLVPTQRPAQAGGSTLSSRLTHWLHRKSLEEQKKSRG